MSDFYKENTANTPNSEVREIANKMVREIIDTLKESTKSELFEGTTAYINHPERIFSLKNFKSDRITCCPYYSEPKLESAKIRIYNLYMMAMYNGLEVIKVDENILLFYSPKIPFCKHVSPTVVLSYGDEEEKEDYEIFGEVIFIGFDRKTKSFRDLTTSDFAKIKSLLS